MNAVNFLKKYFNEEVIVNFTLGNIINLFYHNWVVIKITTAFY